MARPKTVKEPVNKAAAIRDYVTKHGTDVRNKDVVEALLAQGIEVSPSQVSQTRQSMDGGEGEEKPARRARKSGVNAEEMQSVLGVVGELGGFEAAESVLTNATKLQEAFGSLDNARAKLSEIKTMASLFGQMLSAQVPEKAAKKSS